MSRNINISDSVDSKNLDGFNTVNIDKLDDVVNHSADVIYYGSFNNVGDQNLIPTLGNMLEKIRVGGTLVVKILNARVLSKLYFENSISSAEYLQSIKQANTLLTPEDINNNIDHSQFVLGKIEYQNYHTLVSIVRKDLV
jgi:hypothetical protein